MKPTEKSTTLDHVLKYIGVFGGVQGLSILISIIRNRLATMFLGAMGYGLITIYNSITEFVGSIGNLGLPIATVRHLSELFENGTEAEINRFVMTVRTWCVWTALFSGFICVAFSPLLAHVFFDHGMSNIMNICLLAPMAMSLIITGGEVSILKGMRRLKRVALVSLLVAFSTFCFTVPFFWSMGTHGILLALICSTVMQTVIHLCFTLPIFPWRVALTDRRIATEGWSVIRIGIPFVVASVARALMLMALAAILTRWGNVEVAGYYKAGYALMASYAGLAFTSMDSDFFPRLSSINKDLERRNTAINQQMRVNLLVMTPLLIALILFMPFVLRILYAKEFQVINDMAVCAVFFTFLRCMTVPIAYLALACGRTKLYLCMEVTYDVVALLIMMGCYQLWGLTGIGIGISLTAVFDFLLIRICYGYRFHFRFSAESRSFAILQGLLLIAALICCLQLNGPWRYVCGGILLLSSAEGSRRILASESHAFIRLRERLPKLRSSEETQKAAKPCEDLAAKNGL